MNNATKILSLFVLAILTFLFIISCNQKKTDTLVFGVFSSMGYPYAFINLNGTLDGFDVELASKLAQKFGKPAFFKDMPLELLRSALKINQIDILSCSLVITQKKLQTMDMVDVYGKPSSEMTFVFWQEIPSNIKTLHDLISHSLQKPIAVEADSAFSETLEHYGVPNLMSLEHCHDLILPIQYGQAFAVAVGPRHALALQKQHHEIKILKVALEKPWGEGVGLGVKKGNVKLKEKLEKAVKELKEDGTIDALKKKWFGEEAQ